MEKEEFEEICRKFKVRHVEIKGNDERGWSGEAWSPLGKVFNATSAHCIVSETEQLENLYQELGDDIRLGLDECYDPQCEFCGNIGNEVDAMLERMEMEKEQ